MRRTLRWRGVVIALVLGVSVSVGIYPLAAAHSGVQSPSWLVGKALKLGLDLRGGVHLRVRARVGEALGAETNATVAHLLELLRDGHVATGHIAATGSARFSVDGVTSDESAAFEQVAADAAPSFERQSLGSGSYSFVMTAQAQAALRDRTLTQTRETIERRVNELGVSEANISPEGANGEELLIDLPGMSDVGRAKAIIQSRGRLEMKIVEQGPAPSVDALAPGNAVPDGMEIIPGTSAEGRPAYYMVHSAASVTGADLRSAQPGTDEFGRPDVEFTLTSAGGRAFGKLTSQNIGRDLAIVLDGRLQSTARIENTITTNGRIAGLPTRQDVENLAVILRAGALPTGLDYLEQNTIGPSLGADAIRAGITASAAGLVMVIAFMVAYYKKAGINATIALICNLVILLVLMAYLGAVMTLPGIAGFVLTMGIGVDSNVLIFERIKEELEAGQTVRASIHAGFSRVFRTLLDTHVSGLVAAACLFQFGTGPIKGFAVTLAIGLFSNLFTSTFVSRWLFDLALARHPKMEHLSI
jgi:preprotein translocase subunit SecD